MDIKTNNKKRIVCTVIKKMEISIFIYRYGVDKILEFY